MPVPVFCCFSISGFPHIKSALKIPGKIQEKSAYRELPEKPKQGQRGAWGGPGGHPARPHPWPRQEAAWEGPPPSGALPWLLFIPVARKPQMRSRFSSFRRGAAATLCSSSGGLIWRLIWPPERGDRRHRHHHHHSILPP